MTIVQDLIDRLRALQNDRLPWFEAWEDIARYAMPNAERFDSGISGRGMMIDSVVGDPVATKRSRDIYDQTSLWAIDRLTAGILSLTTPQAEYWHGLETDDPFSTEPSDEEERYYEKLRNYLFAGRDNPVSGFWVAHKAALYSTCAMGTGVVFIEESAKGVDAPVAYRYVPLSENHLGCDYYGIVDTNFRLFRRSALQCVKMWGDKVSSKTRGWANDPKQKDRTVLLLHAVMPRDEKGSRAIGVRGSSKVASYYVEVDEKHLIGDSGFYEFPFSVYHWQRNNPGPYSEGPMALALADVKSLNALSKTALTASQQMIAPPMATVHDGLNRLNLNPKAMNPGWLDNQGRLLAQPLITAQRPDFAESILEAKANQVRETLYVNLWQILISNPQMTATEAMLRANEKGDLLGPVGSSIHLSMSHTVDREISIIERMGAFRPGSPLAPPRSLAGRSIGVRFTSPLDRLRRGNTVVGMQRLLELAKPMIQINPETADKFDFDAMLDEARDVLGVPTAVFKAQELIEAQREQAKAAQNAMMAAQGVQAAGDAAKSVGEGAGAMQEANLDQILAQLLQGAQQ